MARCVEAEALSATAGANGRTGAMMNIQNTTRAFDGRVLENAHESGIVNARVYERLTFAMEFARRKLAFCARVRGVIANRVVYEGDRKIFSDLEELLIRRKISSSLCLVFFFLSFFVFNCQI